MIKIKHSYEDTDIKFRKKMINRLSFRKRFVKGAIQYWFKENKELIKHLGRLERYSKDFVEDTFLEVSYFINKVEEEEVTQNNVLNMIAQRCDDMFFGPPYDDNPDGYRRIFKDKQRRRKYIENFKIKIEKGL